MEEPDPRVIRAAAAGDEAAFTVLMRSAQPHVWRFLRHLLGDEETAADVTQETFVRVHRSLDRFRHQSRFSTWVFRIARNAAVDEQRRGGRRQRILGAVVPSSPTPDASLGSELRAALDSLSPRLREAFVLVEGFGLTYQDTAEVLSVPTGTVKSRVFRARIELVQWFDADADASEAEVTVADRDPQAQLRRISAALDGDGTLPDPLDADGAAFLEAAMRLRSKVRVEAAATPPDVTDAVLERVRVQSKTRSSPRPLSLVAAAVFVVAAIGAALAVRPGGPIAPAPVLADVGERVLRAQQDVLALDAAVTLVERGAHPEVPVRTYAGTLRYQAPERLWLHLVQDRTSIAAGFPANDLDLVMDDGTAWKLGLRGCPVDAQPGCLGASDARVVSGLAPFAADWVAPLDLVMPVDAFLPGADLAASEAGGVVEITATVARLRRTIDGLRSAGALRAVHATDPVRLELDRDTLTIRRLTVTAGDSAARVAWAASNGYTEPAGTAVLDLTLTERSLPGSPFPSVPTTAERDAGFADRADPGGPAPAWLPPGFSAHRRGVQHGSGATTIVRSWSDGRAWIRVDVTTARAGDALVGGLGPIVRVLEVGGGTGYTDPTGSVVSLHGDGIDAAVSGSVPLAVLVRVAASLPILGVEVPTSWPQGEVLESLPEGALRPDGTLIARYDGLDLLVVVPGPGQTSAVLRQRPGTTLGPAAKADVSQVEVRGVVGRYEPRTQVVTWVEGGWIRELRSEGLDLAALLAIAEDLGS